MAYNRADNQLLLFIRLFLILFIILFILPMFIDKCLSMFILYEAPRGGSVLVSKNIYDTMSFGHRYLLILKSIIFNL